MTNIADDDDDIDFIDENDPPSPALFGRKKDEWTRKLPLGPSSSKNVEDSRRGGDAEPRSESSFPLKEKVLAESTPTNSRSTGKKSSRHPSIDAIKSRMAELSADGEFMLFDRRACIGHILKNEPKEEARSKMVAILELAVSPPNSPQDAYCETGPPAYEGRTRSQIFDEYLITRRPQAFLRFIKILPDEFEDFYESGGRLEHFRTHAGPISGRQMLVISLRYVTQGMSFSTFTLVIGIGVSTAAAIVKEVTEAILIVLHRRAFPRLTRGKLRLVAEMTQERFDYPRAVGFLDGKHIHIKKPKRSGSVL
ncbi:unnamed protein product [Cylicocyclus nassatus]|uniref:Uncharacterized protein n=1 Tax=Cylicocyclus nassatus TaxID=53992 RepID=A0AA36HCX4_CYLNA|nr:unnamed protein product [Cylicocyclus nassatus]